MPKEPSRPPGKSSTWRRSQSAPEGNPLRREERDNRRREDRETPEGCRALKAGAARFDPGGPLSSEPVEDKGFLLERGAANAPRLGLWPRPSPGGVEQNATRVPACTP